MALKIRISGVIGEGSPTPKGKDGVYIVTTSQGLQAVLDANPDERDIHVDINSDGGSCYEGLAIYDALRTSGRNIRTNIVGGCHSIATIVLLAAPVNQRTSNPNTRSLIHMVRSDSGGYATGAELSRIAEEVQREEDRIVQIYVERTKLTEAQARAAMTSEKTHTADDMLRMGFISRINHYTTNSFSKQKAMANNKKPNTLLQRIGAFLVNAAAALDPVNFNYADGDGNVLFSTASEEDNLAVGDAVSFPDDATGGTFELPDGRVVTIEDFVVTAIDTAEPEPVDVAALQAENESLREQLTEAVNLVEEMQAQIQSDYTPANRVTNVSTASRSTKQAAAAQKTKENIKDELKGKHAAGFASRSVRAGVKP